jgi:predicted nucleic acid-binding protein
LSTPKRYEIDRSKLPMVAAVDAGVLMRALEPHHTDKFAEACRDFWTAMLEDKKREIIIPAPSFAEHQRKKLSKLPSTEQVYVVPFSSGCAELLADRFPAEVLDLEIKAFKADYGRDAPGSYIKYDAMIVACAKYHGAQRLVSIDSRVKKRLAELAPIDCQVPTYFYSTDPLQLALPTPAAAPALKVVPAAAEPADDGEEGDVEPSTAAKKRER